MGITLFAIFLRPTILMLRFWTSDVAPEIFFTLPNSLAIAH